MSQRKPKKAASASKRPESMAQLRRALSGRTKAELVDALLELAQADRGVLHQLTARFDVAAAPNELVPEMPRHRTRSVCNMSGVSILVTEESARWQHALR